MQSLVLSNPNFSEFTLHVDDDETSVNEDVQTTTFNATSTEVRTTLYIIICQYYNYGGYMHNTGRKIPSALLTTLLKRASRMRIGSSLNWKQHQQQNYPSLIL